MSLLTAAKKKARGRFVGTIPPTGGGGTEGLPNGFLLPTGWEVAAAYDQFVGRITGNPVVTEGARLAAARAVASNTTPANGAALEAALSALTGNQKVTLTNAATYTCTNTVTISAGANTSNWRYVGPTDPSFLPASALTRVDSSHRAQMPKLSFAPANAADGSHPAIWLIADGTKKLFVEGIDFRANQASGQLGYFVYMGHTSGASPNYAAMPDEIVFRHCWFDGVGAFAVMNGIAMNANRVVIEGCYIENVSSANPGGTEQDGAAVTAWNGRYNRVTNCYLEAEYMCLFIQGLGAPSAAQVPQDWCIEKNELAKRPEWFTRNGGVNLKIKNNYEQKSGVRFVVQDNDINGTGGTLQDATLAVIKMVRQGGPYPDSAWWETGHLYFGHNVFRNGKNGLAMSGDPELTGGIAMHDVVIEFNRFTLLGPRDKYQTQTFGQGIRWENLKDLTIRRNTLCAGFPLGIMGVRGANTGGVSITDNVVSGVPWDFNSGTFRNLDAGVSSDPAYLKFLWDEFKTVYPVGAHLTTNEFKRNALLVQSSNHALSNPYNAGSNPEGNRFDDNYTGVSMGTPDPNGQFVDVGAMGANAYLHDDWTLKPASSFKGIAENGNDPGAEHTSLNTVETKALAGVW